MPATNLTFGTVSGGFNGGNAILNNTSEAIVDLGKNPSFATMVLSNMSGQDSIPTDATILGVEVNIEDHGNTGNTSTVDFEMFHNGTSAVSDTITLTIDNNQNTAPELGLVGGGTTLWGKTWTQSDFDSGNFLLRLDNPLEPSGGTASLMFTFIFLRVSWEASAAPLKLISGLIKLTSGLIKI